MILYWDIGQKSPREQREGADRNVLIFFLFLFLCRMATAMKEAEKAHAEWRVARDHCRTAVRKLQVQNHEWVEARSVRVRDSLDLGVLECEFSASRAEQEMLTAALHKKKQELRMLVDSGVELQQLLSVRTAKANELGQQVKASLTLLANRLREEVTPAPAAVVPVPEDGNRFGRWLVFANTYLSEKDRFTLTVAAQEGDQGAAAALASADEYFLKWRQIHLQGGKEEEISVGGWDEGDEYDLEGL